MWVLFDDAVRASVARAVGTRLLTEAMSHRAISMASYDRLFPNQHDAGGWVRQPDRAALQRTRRDDGCTLFLDANLEPFADRWAHLAQARRLGPDAARDLAADSELSRLIDDERTDGSALDLTFTGTLGPGQRRAVVAVESHEIGVLVAPPGAGKTVVAAELIARRGRSALIVVHRRPLLEQWRSRLAEFLDLDPGDIGSPATLGQWMSRSSRSTPARTNGPGSSRASAVTASATT